MLSPNGVSDAPNPIKAAAPPLMIIGNRGGTNIGGSFERGAGELGIRSIVLESRRAMEGPKLLQKLMWHFGGHTPVRLAAFGREILERCAVERPQAILTTGLAPVNAETLTKLGDLGVRRINFLTDDPWNRSHVAPWFFKALRHYDLIFSPRRSNIDDLRNASGATVSYLPFAFDPSLFRQPVLSESERRELESDVFFAGGADADRVPYITALRDAGMRVGLFGSYWERFPETRPIAGHQLDAGELCRRLAACRIALCLVRRANRDGHCMRTFEVPAVGGCMLTEDTPEHREIFGEDGNAVVYFSTIEQMVSRARWLLENERERERIARNAREQIGNRHHTYAARLASMLATAGIAAR